MREKIKIRVAEPDIQEEDAKAVYDAVKRGFLSTGPIVEKFEKSFASFIGSKYAIAVNSGTAALHLALEALDIKNGDEVITTPFTFAATSNVIVHQKAVPIFVDIEPDTFNLDPSLIEKYITSKTKAIMPIHYAGQPAEMDKINEIAQKHGIDVIEDAAPAVGSTYKNRKAGTLGRIAGFSFFPDKNMTTGEGGMITTNDFELAEKCKILRKNGASKRYYNIYIGWNYKMSDINAALGLSQLKRINKIISRKNKIANYYTKNLPTELGIRPPIVKEYNKCSFMLYSILIKNNVQREKIKSELEKRGIETRINFPPMHLQPIYRKIYGFKKKSFPMSENISKRILGLPIFTTISQKQQDFIIKTIKSSLE